MSNYATISQMEYDALGQVKKKKLGTAPLETLAYDYNIRGWLLGENRDYAKSASSTTNYFGFDLGYDKTAIAPTGGSSIGSYTNSQLNGNKKSCYGKVRVMVKSGNTILVMMPPTGC